MARQARDPIDDLIAALPAWQLAAFRFNDAVARRLGIAPSDLQCLFVLDRGGPTSPSDLAARVGLTSGATSRMVERLIRVDMVTRVSDEQDRRRVWVELTAEAKTALHALYDPLDDELRRLLRPWGRDLRARLLTFVEEAREQTEAQTEAVRTP